MRTRVPVINHAALLNQSQVSKFLGTTEKFLEARRVRGGGPPFVRVGRLVRYRPDDLENFIVANIRYSTKQESVEP